MQRLYKCSEVCYINWLYHFNRSINHTSQGVPDMLKYRNCHVSSADLMKGLKMSHSHWKSPKNSPKILRWFPSENKWSGKYQNTIKVQSHKISDHKKATSDVCITISCLYTYVTSTIQYKKVRHLGRPMLVQQLEFPAKNGYNTLSDLTLWFV